MGNGTAPVSNQSKIEDPMIQPLKKGGFQNKSTGLMSSSGNQRLQWKITNL